MIVRSTGLEVASMIGSKNLLDFAYTMFLWGRARGIKPHELESAVRRWIAMSLITGRQVSSPETQFDVDIRGIRDQGLVQYVDLVVASELTPSFWDSLLPQQMATSSSSSPYWAAFRAAQIKLQSTGFLSAEISVQALIQVHGDVHHVYPRNYLKSKGAKPAQYNQIANFVITQSEINIAIGDKAPALYFTQLRDQVAGGEKRYGAIDDDEALKINLVANAIPLTLLERELPYDEFLVARRSLMAKTIERYFEGLA